MHKGPILNDIFLKLMDSQNFTLIDAISGYHNLKLDKKSPSLTIFLCKVCKCKYARLPFRTILVGDMNTGGIFKELPNAFGIADDIVIVGYDDDGTDHDST